MSLADVLIEARVKFDDVRLTFQKVVLNGDSLLPSIWVGPLEIQVGTVLVLWRQVRYGVDLPNQHRSALALLRLSICVHLPDVASFNSEFPYERSDPRVIAATKPIHQIQEFSRLVKSSGGNINIDKYPLYPVRTLEK